MEQTQKQKNGFMMKLATFIVDKRNLFLLITIILLAFSAFSRNWVEVENDQTAYLPASCETKQAPNVMSDQFTTYGTAEVMVANITYDEAEALSGRIGAVKGVQSVAFDETSGHYARASALFTVTFDRDETDDACLTSLDAVKELLADYDLFVSTDLGNTLAETIDSEVSVIMVYVAVIIVAVLILTSRTYGEVPALLLTFIAAMVFMQFKIDPDMGICPMKSILFALLAVFIVMPGLLVLFMPLIEKTEHRSWVPKISFAGRYAWASRKVVPFVFLTVIAACFFLSGKCPYAYGYSNLTTPKLNETQIAEKLIDDTFTTPNMLAFVVPAGDYEKEAVLLTELESRGEIDHAVGLANTEAMDGYMLADKLTHQSRERVFVVGLVTGEISGTVSGPGGRNRLHRLSASAAGLCQALRRGYLFKGLTVVLTDDIDADGAAVSIPIFLGDFDGQGHKITGLCLTESCSEYGLFSRVESGASVRNLTVEGEVIPAGTQTDVGGIVGQMVPDITLRFSSGGLDELQTELNALQSLINRTLDDAQSASDSVTGGVSRIAACADAAQSSVGAAIGLRAVCRRSRHACRVAALGGHCGGAHGHRRRDNARYPQKTRKSRQTRAINIAQPLCLWQSGWAIFFQKDFALLDELICFGSGSVSAFPPCRRTGQASGCGQNCGHRSCAPRADPCPHP